jgi:hypothetical protein
MLIELFLQVGLCIEDLAKAAQRHIKLFQAGRAYCRGGSTENPMLYTKVAPRRL